jgi:hypothetical protein
MLVNEIKTWVVGQFDVGVKLPITGLSGRFGVNLREAPVTQQLGSINQFGSMHSGSERQDPRERLTGRIHKKVCRRPYIRAGDLNRRPPKNLLN